MYSKHFKKCRTISEKKYYLKLDTKFLQFLKRLLKVIQDVTSVYCY